MMIEALIHINIYMLNFSNLSIISFVFWPGERVRRTEFLYITVAETVRCAVHVRLIPCFPSRNEN